MSSRLAVGTSRSTPLWLSTRRSAGTLSISRYISTHKMFRWNIQTNYVWAHCRLSTVHTLSIVRCPLSIHHCPLSTVNCQFSILNSPLSIAIVNFPFSILHNYFPESLLLLITGLCSALGMSVLPLYWASIISSICCS